MSAAFSSKTSFNVIQHSESGTEPLTVEIATEVPLTLLVNDIELATLMCSPMSLESLAIGFLFTSGFITSTKEIQSLALDEEKWRIFVSLAHQPDQKLTGKRLYTSGCGKGVMYSSLNEISLRHPLPQCLYVKKEIILKLMKWFQTCSQLHKDSGGVHTACLSQKGDSPQHIDDDIGRHNAVDKVIGSALREGTNFSECLLMCSGRVSSEILFKVKRCGISMIISLGSPTHQSVLLAQEMNVCLIGFARGGRFTVFAHPERICG